GPGRDRAAGGPPLGRPAQPAECPPQRTLPAQDLAPALGDLTLTGINGVTGETLLRLRPPGHLRGPQPHRRAGQRRFRLEGDHAAIVAAKHLPGAQGHRTRSPAFPPPTAVLPDGTAYHRFSSRESG